VNALTSTAAATKATMKVITAWPAPMSAVVMIPPSSGHHADSDRQHQPDVLAARHEQPGQPTDHKSDEQPGDKDGSCECHDFS